MAQTRCAEPGCGAKSPSPARSGWMKVWKVGHKDEAKFFCPVHGGQRGFYLANPHNERLKAARAERRAAKQIAEVDATIVAKKYRPKGRPIDPMPF